MHSSGSFFVYGGCLYVGGRLWYDTDGVQTYLTGREERQTYFQNGTQTWLKLTNVKAFLCNKGVNHWGDRPEVRGYEAHDIVRSGQLL